MIRQISETKLRDLKKRLSYGDLGYFDMSFIPEVPSLFFFIYISFFFSSKLQDSSQILTPFTSASVIHDLTPNQVK